MIKMMDAKRVLIVAAHPDDEVLGCGGSIAKHSKNGAEVNIIIAAEGITSRNMEIDKENRKDEVENLKHCSINALKVMGGNEVHHLGYPDNRMDSITILDIVKEIELKIKKLHPEIIYIHHCGDVNVDHRVLHEAVVTATRPLPNNELKMLLSFEVASSTEWQTINSAPHFIPNIFIDIEDYWEVKEKALNCYASEMRDWPHPRSIHAIKSLAEWRGAQSGKKAAESFMLLRGIC